MPRAQGPASGPGGSQASETGTGTGCRGHAAIGGDRGHGRHGSACAELSEQRVHDRVDGFGGVPVQRDAGPARGADELRDRVVGLLEQRGHPL